MFKVFAGISPILVAATLVMGAVDGQQPTPGLTQASAPTTIVGCVVRNGSVDPDKGTRTLDIAPGALALTNARVLGDAARVGSAPGGLQGSDTGTIPQRTIVGARGNEPSTLAFALVGDRSAGLDQFVGRRVEVVGHVGAGTEANQARGTTGVPRDAAPVPGVGTREERPAESTAHPSAEMRKLEVVSFKAATGDCQ